MKDKANISVVISAYNEEARIRACLESVAFADEVLVIDNESTDKTVAIAKSLGATVISRKNNLMLNINKNFGFTKVKHEWILNLDADERVTEELEKKIYSLAQSDQSEVVGYWIPRKNIIFNKWMKGEMWWPDYQLRLFRKGSGKFPEKHVHEYIEVFGKTEHLEDAIIHENYSSISQFIYKLDKIYTTNEASQLMEKGYRVVWIDAIRFPIRDFLKTFFAQKGYQDGMHGLVLSLLQAFYSLVVFAKAWEMTGFKEQTDPHFLKKLYQELYKSKNEFQYWFYTAFMQETKSPLKKIHLRILRKLSRRS